MSQRFRDASVPEEFRLSWHEKGAGPENSDPKTPNWLSADWSGESLAALVEGLSQGAAGLRALSSERLLAAWLGAVTDLRGGISSSMDSPVRGAGPSPVGKAVAARGAALKEAMAPLCRLSPAGLEAGLGTLLDGVDGDRARQLVQLEAARRQASGGRAAVVILSSNLPGLAVQSLLPALVVRRPILIKSSSAEPLFAPAFLEALCRREPALRACAAAVTWRGGDRELEEQVFAAAGLVVAYGGGTTIDDLRSRAGGKLIAYGPKISLAAVSGDWAKRGSAGKSLSAGSDKAGDVNALGAITEGLARDIALFDQRGCLSVQSVYTEGDALPLAEALCRELRALADTWPPGTPDPGTLAAVRQIRDAAIMRGARVLDVDAGRLAAGGVVLDPDPELRPSPGCRWVRMHALGDLRDIPDVLEPWRGRLQGVALAGRAAEALAAPLQELGVSHLAPPGSLQSPNLATWENGGIAPLEVFRRDSPEAAEELR